MTQAGARSAESGPAVATRLLIVDDHDMFAESLRLALSAETDLEVVATAATLAEARTLVTAASPDVVLLDHRLPDGLGVESIGLLKALQPGVQVVILTAAVEDAVLVQATEAGCSGFMLKTSPLDELVDAVRVAAAGEIMIGSDLLGRLLNRLHHHDDGRRNALTAREREILELISRGMTNSAIATQLFISVNTVRNHVQSVLAKLGAHSKLEALSIAIKDGIIDPPGPGSV